LKTVRTNTKHWKPEKLGPNFTGPWIVESVHSNDYSCRHVTHGLVCGFHVDMLKPYFGTLDMAKQAALLNYDQFVVTAVKHYVGDPMDRKTLEFCVQYADGDTMWKGYNRDLFDCEGYKLFCVSRPELWACVHKVEQARKERSRLNKEPITFLDVCDIIFVDLRALGAQWYNGYGANALEPTLPNENESIYVVQCVVSEWLNSLHTKVRVDCELLGVHFSWNHDSVRSWARYSEVEPSMVKVTTKFLGAHPQIKIH
jgi:hypothetical protein